MAVQKKIDLTEYIGFKADTDFKDALQEVANSLTEGNVSFLVRQKMREVVNDFNEIKTGNTQISPSIIRAK